MPNLDVEAPLGTIWILYPEYHPYPAPFLWEALGLIPYFLDPSDSRLAVPQFRDKYQGGFDTMRGFTLIDGDALSYPEDPLMYPIASTTMHGERILIYAFGWVCVQHADRTIDVARLD